MSYFGGDHDELDDDFDYEENVEFAEIITDTFTQMEIEFLEEMADTYYEYMQIAGKGVTVEGPFITDLKGDEE